MDKILIENIDMADIPEKILEYLDPEEIYEKLEDVKIKNQYRKKYKKTINNSTFFKGEFHSYNDKPAYKDKYCIEYHKHGKLHREGGKPAFITKKGLIRWYKDGKPYHSDIEPKHPCEIREDGAYIWYDREGELHRDAGKPAIVYKNGKKEYYVHGKKISGKK
jgi:hypothetical protein